MRVAAARTAARFPVRRGALWPGVVTGVVMSVFAFFQQELWGAPACFEVLHWSPAARYVGCLTQVGGIAPVFIPRMRADSSEHLGSGRRKKLESYCCVRP